MLTLHPVLKDKLRTLFLQLVEMDPADRDEIQRLVQSLCDGIRSTSSNIGDAHVHILGVSCDCLGPSYSVNRQVPREDPPMRIQVVGYGTGPMYGWFYRDPDHRTITGTGADGTDF